MINNYRVRSRDGIANMIRILPAQRTGIKICHINAQSLQGKIDEFRFRFENSHMDLICISETWFDSDTSDLSVSLNGYNVRRVDRDDGYGGVAIYIRKGIHFSVKCTSKDVQIMDDIDLSVPKNLVEYMFIEVNSEGRK